MASKPLIIATLVGATVGVPYLATRSSASKPAGRPQAASYSPFSTTTPTRLPAVGDPMQTSTPLPGSGSFGNRAPYSGAQFTSVNQVIRFDVTKDWVYRNWDRKSTGPTDVGLFSVRVPLVMAPQISALAGALTYYFNSQGQVEHISFRGRTGDSTPLVQLLTTTYQLERVDASTGDQVYQTRYRGQVQSELRTHPEAVLWSSSPNQSIAVELELARPGSERVLPPRPTGFEGMQQAAAAQAAASTPPALSQSAADAKSGSYLDRIRHATPQEESQVLWKRYPN